MPTRDNVNNTRVVTALAQATVTTTTTGLTIDTQGYDRVSFAVFAGPSGDALAANKAVEFDIAESVDGVSWNFAADYDIIALETQSVSHEGVGIVNGATNSGAFFLATSNTPLALVGGLQPCLRGGYIGTKRYIRLVATMTGTQTSGTPMFAVAVLGGTLYNPVIGSLS